MDWKKILFIYNPVAGRSQIRDQLLDIITILSAGGYRVECYPTKFGGDARRLVRECREEYLYICCAGGDGCARGFCKYAGRGCRFRGVGQCAKSR